MPFSSRIIESFKLPKARISIAVESQAENVVKQIMRAEQKNGTVTVVEVYPGYGLLTKALLKSTNPSIRKVYAFEPEKKCESELTELSKEFNGRLDFSIENVSREKALQKIGEKLDNEGVVPTYPWEESQIPLPTKSDNYVLSLLLRALTSRLSFFAFGRVEMNLLLPDPLLRRVYTDEVDTSRRVLDLCIQAFAETKVLMVVPQEDVAPKSKKSTEKKNQLSLVRITPLATPKIESSMYNTYKYILSNLFHVPTQPLKQRIRSIACGAENLLPKLSFNTKIAAGRMTVDQVCELTRVFEEWPFRPKLEELIHVYDEEFEKKRRR
ncbi:9149_t:CDS:2 [Ambispora gerdemannii]|uniref:rRNA adenine N(6)-methyltransferase n=1 Tax=Ambispora gerdemannii TaxID=144530 RepID=A0A9N8UZ58_9GLOM|nr:9149_t:CDS:2 [Ambispora gerdemannii]